MIEVDEASASVTLNIQGAFTGAKLGELIQALCKARASIAEDPSSPVGQQVQATHLGAWYTEFAPDKQSTLLLILVKGLGWAGVTLSPADRLKLAYHLIAQQHTSMSPTAATAPAISAGGNTLH
jgi:hypothetical protein